MDTRPSRKHCCKSFARTVRKLDGFGEPVTLKYKGESTFKTFGGGVCSIIYYLIVLGFFAFFTRNAIND